MVDVTPFRALRYARAGSTDLAQVTAPPYDAIDVDEQRRLYDASPHNIVRIERGRASAADDDHANPYTRGADDLRAWLADGVLEVDDGASMWVYEERFDHEGGPGVQRGLLAAMELSPWAAGEVLPHERIFRGPVEDRKRLLRHVPINVSPVFVVHETVDPELEEFLGGARADAADLETVDPDGTRHRLWRVSDAAAHEVARRSLRDTRVLMADGHHRYTTALEHHDETGSPGSDRILTYVVGVDDGPLIQPMHRLVRRLPDQSVGRLRLAGFSMHPFDGDVEALRSAVQTAAETTFGMVTSDGLFVLRVRDAAAADRLHPRDTPPEVRALDVALLQAAVTIPLGVHERIEDLLYTSDHAAAATAVGAGMSDALFLVRAPSLGQVRRAVEGGHRLPPKSTSFHPKPRTGLVMRPLDPGSLAAGASRPPR